MMRLKRFDRNLANVNSYLLSKQQKAIVIDPGFNGAKILAECESKGLQIIAVILTHGHADHIYDLPLISARFDLDLYLAEPDVRLLRDDTLNYAKAFGYHFQMPENIRIKTVADHEVIHLLDERFECLLTPGHTKGSLCIKTGRWLFSGDTLFADSIGRTDLFSGSLADIKKSLDLLKTSISRQTTVYPGHGPSMTMAEILENNPYLK